MKGQLAKLLFRALIWSEFATREDEDKLPEGRRQQSLADSFFWGKIGISHFQAEPLNMPFSFSLTCWRSNEYIQGFRVKEGLSCVPRRGNVPRNVQP